MIATIGFPLGDDYRARSKLPIITSIPKPVPSIVGHLVPTTGSVGWFVGAGACANDVDVAVAVATAHVQSVSGRHCVFLHIPVVAPLAI